MSFHLHIDCVGGIAGDMFVGAMLDAYPELEQGLFALLRELPLPGGISFESLPHNDGVLVGTRFDVTIRDAAGHEHRSATEIVQWLETNVKDNAIASQAKAIIELLAAVEGRIHGIPSSDVAFHEVGAWDSIVDIVAASALLVRSGASSWSVGALPIGSGRVKSQHGDLPVPAPAVAVLLEGFAVFDDGRYGERITPTGAAILRHLQPAQGAPSKPLLQGRVGVGFGTKTFAGLSNVVRVRELLPRDSEYVGQDGRGQLMTDSVAVLEFEIDDQTSEDLAIGLDHLRMESGVLDVVQMPVFGKKNRLCVSVRVLVEPSVTDHIVRRVFQETTTLGIRTSAVSRTVLQRSMHTIEGASVKLVERPGLLNAAMRTAKTDAGSVEELQSWSERQKRRWLMEATAIEQDRERTISKRTISARTGEHGERNE